jgi:hypothetical protein
MEDGADVRVWASSAVALRGLRAVRRYRPAPGEHPRDSSVTGQQVRRGGNGAMSPRIPSGRANAPRTARAARRVPRHGGAGTDGGRIPKDAIPTAVATVWRRPPAGASPQGRRSAGSTLVCPAARDGARDREATPRHGCRASTLKTAFYPGRDAKRHQDSEMPGGGAAGHLVSSYLSLEGEGPVEELTSQRRPDGDRACGRRLQRRRGVLQPEVEAADSQCGRRGGGPQQDR